MIIYTRLSCVFIVGHCVQHKVTITAWESPRATHNVGTFAKANHSGGTDYECHRPGIRKQQAQSQGIRGLSSKRIKSLYVSKVNEY